MRPVDAEAVLLRVLRTEVCAALERECVRRGLLFARLGNVDLPNVVSIDWASDEVKSARAVGLLKRAEAAGVYVAAEAFSASVEGVGCRVVYDVVALGPRELAVRWAVMPLEGP